MIIKAKARALTTSISCDSLRLIVTFNLLLWSCTGRISLLYFLFRSKSSYSRLASGFAATRWQHSYSRHNTKAVTIACDIARHVDESSPDCHRLYIFSRVSSRPRFTCKDCGGYLGGGMERVSPSHCPPGVG